MKQTSLVYLLHCPPNWVKTPPLGIEYIKNYLNYQGIKTEVVDLNLEVKTTLRYRNKQWLPLNENFEASLFSYLETNYPQIINRTIKRLANASIIGFSLFKRNQYFSFSLAEKIKQTYPAKEIVFGGPQVLFMKLNKKPFNQSYRWVVGEGELPMQQIASGNSDKIISYQQIDDLDKLPFLNFNGFNLENYSQVLPLFSSRGCINHCRFCTERLLFKDYRQHSPAYITEQIKHLSEQHGIINYSFQDSMLNANNRWLAEFSKLLIKHGLKINWEAQMAVKANFPLQLAKLIKSSGCYNIFIGLESGSDKTLRKMQKGFNTKQAITFFETLNQAKLHFEISLIVGYPQESSAEFKQTVNFIKNNRKLIPKIAQINPYVDYYSSSLDYNIENLAKVKQLIKLIKSEKIPYTNSFINNLIY
jgi:radical SAM superfamily enzyme YgiQ (UPF0313 family)